MATRIVGPNSIVQGALPDILSRTPESFFDETMRFIEVQWVMFTFTSRPILVEWMPEFLCNVGYRKGLLLDLI